MPIEKLLKQLPGPAQRAILDAGIKTVEELSNMSEAEIMSLHGLGPNAVQTIKRFMAENGMALKET
jgi:ERCC4-type nuclease